jgi:YggT family protein
MMYPVLSLVNLLFEILSILILVDVLGSWILAARTQLPDVIYTILALVHRITSPLMEPIRRVIPPLGGLDMSPIIALIGLQVIQRLLVSAMIGMR